jgi:hypothetical protein
MPDPNGRYAALCARFPYLKGAKVGNGCVIHPSEYRTKLQEHHLSPVFSIFASVSDSGLCFNSHFGDLNHFLAGRFHLDQARSVLQQTLGLAKELTTAIAFINLSSSAWTCFRAMFPPKMSSESPNILPLT